MTKEERIIEALKNSTSIDQVTTWNEYQDGIRGDAYISRMEEFDELFSHLSPTDLLLNINTFDIRDRYFTCTIWGIDSSDDPGDWMDFEELAAEAAERNNDFYDSKIREILNS